MNKLSMSISADYISFVEKKIENNTVNITGFLNIASNNSGLNDIADSYYYINESFTGDWYKLYENTLYQKISDTNYTLLNFGDETVGLENILLNDYTVVANYLELTIFEFTTQTLFYRNSNGTFTNYGSQYNIYDDISLTNLIMQSPFRFVYFGNTVESSMFNYTFIQDTYYLFDNGTYNDVSSALEVFTIQDAFNIPIPENNYYNPSSLFRVGPTPTFNYSHMMNQGEVWKTNADRTDIELQIHTDCYTFDDILNTDNGNYLHINNDFFTQREYQYGQILLYNDIDGIYNVYNPVDDETFILLSDANIKFYNNTVTYSTESKVINGDYIISFFNSKKRGYGNDCWIVSAPNTTKYYYINSSTIYKYDGSYNTWTWDGNGTYFNLKYNYNVINDDNIFYIYDSNLPNYKVSYIYKFDCTELIDYIETYSEDINNVYNTLNSVFIGS